jgi:alkylation response protein AidB-like acyl-CoA dehydrogenase
MKTTNLRVIAAVAGGGVPGAESSMLKIRGTEIRQEILADPPRHGPVRAPLSTRRSTKATRPRRPGGRRRGRHYFNNRKLSIFGGSNEIQKNIISKMILGL